MNDLTPRSTYGVLTTPATLTMERLLPGPMERAWAVLVDSDLRRHWLAAGAMALSSIFVLGNALRLKRWKPPMMSAVGKAPQSWHAATSDTSSNVRKMERDAA